MKCALRTVFFAKGLLFICIIFRVALFMCSCICFSDQLDAIAVKKLVYFVNELMERYFDLVTRRVQLEVRLQCLCVKPQPIFAGAIRSRGVTRLSRTVLAVLSGLELKNFWPVQGSLDSGGLLRSSLFPCFSGFASATQCATTSIVLPSVSVHFNAMVVARKSVL